MCERAVEEGLLLMFGPDHFKTKRMCERVAKAYPCMLCIVPDWFVVLQEMWYEDFDDIDYLIGWRNGHLKRKGQKAKIKEGLMPAAWHPSR